MIRIGLIGKTNTGKTTFFNSATLGSEEIANYPFTTKKPIHGNAHVITLCVHKEFEYRTILGIHCVKMVGDYPCRVDRPSGLIKGAWEGKGLGNQSCPLLLNLTCYSISLMHLEV